MRHAFVLAFLLLFSAPLFAEDTPIPPKDAEWTIYCTDISGPDHIRQAKNLPSDLVRKTGMRGWYVVHGDAESKLFFGFYRTVETSVDKKEANRAHNDLHAIQEITGSSGEHPFARAGIVQIVPPDPDGPPAWNLANLNRNKAPDDPNRAYFTLQIAAYKDSPLLQAKGSRSIRFATHARKAASRLTTTTAIPSPRSASARGRAAL